MKVRPIILALVLFLGIQSVTLAGYKDEIGYTRLIEEFGDQLPDGAGIPVAQIEYIRNSTWAPGATGELAHENFTYSPADTGDFSPHAYEVGQFFYGSKSMVPGVNEVHAFRNTYWYSNMNRLWNIPPKTNPWRVENHSWTGTLSGPVRWDEEIIGRMDYRVVTQNIFITVSAGNTTNTMPPLLGNTYNAVVMGRASGVHNRGGTNLFTHKRMKPDLVAPVAFTSYAAPVAAAAATLLIARAEEEVSLGDAVQVPVVKALLMAGATKDAFPSWTNSPTRPLDEVFGAGNLNIYHSYQTLLAGKHEPNGHDLARNAGWDWNKTPDSTNSRRYPFTIQAGSEGEFSAVLAWNAVPIPGEDDNGNINWTLFSYELDNLSLRLWKLDGENEPLNEITASISEIDNLQHIFLTDLAPGTYALEVSGSAANVSYGLAWRAPSVDVAGESQPPVIVSHPSADVIPVTASKKLAVAVDGPGTIQYQWVKDNMPLSENERILGTSSSVLTIMSLAPEDEGEYSVLVSNEHGIVASEPAFLELVPFVPPISWGRTPGNAAKIDPAELLQNVIGSDGGPVSLESVASVSTGGVALEYDGEWLHYHSPDDFAQEDVFTLTVIDSRERQAECVVNVLVADHLDWIHAHRVLLMERVEGSDHFLLRFAGLPDAAYRIETSTDLVSWEALTTVTATPDGIYEYIHEGGFQDQHRFYRTIIE